MAGSGVPVQDKEGSFPQTRGSRPEAEGIDRVPQEGGLGKGDQEGPVGAVQLRAAADLCCCHEIAWTTASPANWIPAAFEMATARFRVAAAKVRASCCCCCCCCSWRQAAETSLSSMEAASWTSARPKEAPATCSVGVLPLPEEFQIGSLGELHQEACPDSAHQARRMAAAVARILPALMADSSANRVRKVSRPQLRMVGAGTETPPGLRKSVGSWETATSRDSPGTAPEAEDHPSMGESCPQQLEEVGRQGFLEDRSCWSWEADKTRRHTGCSPVAAEGVRFGRRCLAVAERWDRQSTEGIRHGHQSHCSHLVAETRDVASIGL